VDIRQIASPVIAHFGLRCFIAAITECAHEPIKAFMCSLADFGVTGPITRKPSYLQHIRIRAMMREDITSFDEHRKMLRNWWSKVQRKLKKRSVYTKDKFFTASSPLLPGWRSTILCNTPDLASFLPPATQPEQFS
jgi:hypothetical protein